jgi:hypothetical protein
MTTVHFITDSTPVDFYDILSTSKKENLADLDQHELCRSHENRLKRHDNWSDGRAYHDSNVLTR